MSMINVYTKQNINTFIDTDNTDEVVQTAYILGDEFGDYIRDLTMRDVEDKYYAEMRLDSDLVSYEEELFEIRSSCDYIQDRLQKLMEYVDDTKRINKTDIHNILEEVIYELSNMS